MPQDDFIRVTKVQVLTIARKMAEFDRSLPFLRFLLENGGEFMISMVPREIALAVSLHLSSKFVEDSRLRIYDLVGQLAIIHKVEIDSMIPGTSVYDSKVVLTPEGFSSPVTFSMIPSNATLIAVLNEAPIYISRRLWIEFKENNTKSVESTDENDDFK